MSPFKKIVSNLPCNPELIVQVAFYAGRLKNEEILRRSGVILIFLAMTVQVFAVVSPPEPTLAASNNDIIRGGFTSRSQAVNLCRNNTQNFRNILDFYKVSCERLQRASVETIKSTDYNRQLYSLGRIAQGPVIGRTGKPTNEFEVKINGRKYYMRNLWAWDSRNSSSYKMLKTKNKDGKTIMIMFNCGNIVTVGKYDPPKPKTNPESETEKLPEDVCPELAGIQGSKDECDVCPNLPYIQTNPDDCYPCPEAKQDDSQTACLRFEKTASNMTQELDDANGTLAFGGDIIVYKLSATNHGNQPVPGFVLDENITDVLEYSDIINLDGGNLDSDQNVVWPAELLEPNATLSKELTVRVKNPVPETPFSASDPNSYDLVMTNVFYGQSVQIELPRGIIKSTEQLTTILPKTGPGGILTFCFTVTSLSSYFLARSRLLAKELDEVRKDYLLTGGGE